MQGGQGLFILPQFVCVERAVMVRGSLAMVAHRGAVVRHSSKILLVVILRPKFIGSPPLRVMMVPEMEMQGLAERPNPSPSSSSTGSSSCTHIQGHFQRTQSLQILTLLGIKKKKKKTTKVITKGYFILIGKTHPMK